MTYGETANVKSDLGITGTAFDARLSDWNDKASQEWDDIIQEEARERRLITTLPELPLQASEVTEVDKDGTNNLIKARYFENQKQFESAKEYRKIADRLAIKRLESFKHESEWYSRIIS